MRVYTVRALGATVWPWPWDNSHRAAGELESVNSLRLTSHPQVQVVKLSNTTTISCPPPQDHKSTTHISNYKYTIANVLFFTFQAVLACCLTDYCFHSCCWKTFGSAMSCVDMHDTTVSQRGRSAFFHVWLWLNMFRFSLHTMRLKHMPLQIVETSGFHIHNTAVQLMSHVYIRSVKWRLQLMSEIRSHKWTLYY